MPRLLAAVAFALLPAAAPPARPTLPAPAPGHIDFARDVQPILTNFCVECHGPAKQKGSLRLDQRASPLDTGNIVAGKSANSPLVHRVAGTGPEGRMPPRGAPLTPRQIALLRAWIDQGAEWPTTARAAGAGAHWAYRPLVRPTVPEVQDRSRVRNPIDRFVQARLEAAGLAPAPPAERRALIRRLSFDLLGLPPAPEEVDAFLADARPDAYERLVDRLLASPAYGERYARHWLDVVHFAETHGHDQDVPRENAWPYRDYLVRAFNADRPWGRMIEQQVAGDVLEPGSPDGILALGMLAAGPWDESSQQSIRDDTLDKKQAQNLDRDDMVTTVMSAFVSATVHCARCHDHKFDPISQEEHYALQAVFSGVDRANRPYDADPELERARRSLLALQRRAAPSTASGRDVQKRLQVLPPPKLVYAAASDFTPQESFKPAKGCRPVFMLRRGEITRPLREAKPGALSCVPGLPATFELAKPHDEGARRAALARWLSDGRNVLTWRSIANRAWHYHFGRGIVATPGDLGKMGAVPTHPELLDWLACEPRDAGGSLKHLHRLIVTSDAYRRAVRHDAAAAKADADNLLLWRMNRTRLDAESVRDAVLTVSGLLDRAMGGPSVKQFRQNKGIHVTPKVEYDAFDVDSPGSYRRSVYRFVFRTLPDPFFDVLDCPDASQFTPARASSITPLQALALLNDRFMVRQAEHFAERVRREAGPEVARQVELAYRLALGRPASAEEVALLGRYVVRHGMANACRVLLNCNEFLFVD
jgi:mono/diheme cytochrome c family protein